MPELPSERVPDVPTGPTEEREGSHSDAPVDRPTGAEDILPAALDVDWHPDRARDSGSPLAGLLAAAAAQSHPLDARAYSRYRDARGGEWATVAELEAQYGSFGAAMRAAGIEDPGRS